MEKYEFNIKAEQMQKMSEAGDYKTAMQIADTIDWRRVRNANMLASVSEIYEHNGEYEEAKDILLMAFDRAPVGKRFLFKLSEISVKAGDMNDAMEFYRQFSELSPEDSRVYLLRYMILKAKGARAEQLVGPLEEYTSQELDERWLYELAVLYEAAGQIENCVRTCDRITLLFGLGQYVDKALELKQKYQPLSREQQDLADNREKYESKLRNVERSYSGSNDDFNELINRPTENHLPAEAAAKSLNREVQKSEDLRLNQVENTEEEEVQNKEQNVPVSVVQAAEPVEETKQIGEKEETSEDIIQTESVKEKTAEDPVTKAENTETELEIASLDEVSEENKPSADTYHMIIEALSLEEGFRVAVNEIKYFHEKYHLEYKVAKINADKLNEKGFASFRDKLNGKDLIIEEAGKLNYSVVDEVTAYIEQNTDYASIILIDVVDHFDKMAEEKPKFIQLFDLVSAVPEEKEEEVLEDVNLDAAAVSEAVNEEKEIVEEKQTTVNIPEEKEEVTEDPVEPESDSEEDFRESEQEKLAAQIRASMERPSRPLDESEIIAPERTEGMEAEVPSTQELSVEDFVAYAQDYIRSIDCVLQGKAVNALFEKAEIMQEDGIKLTKRSAEDMVEEAADKAEKPRFGMFRAKYDKNDKLILREDSFL